MSVGILRVSVDVVANWFTYRFTAREDSAAKSLLLSEHWPNDFSQPQSSIRSIDCVSILNAPNCRQHRLCKRPAQRAFVV